MYRNVNFRTIYDSQDMEATWMSTNRWMDKEIVVHIYSGVLLSHKKEHIRVNANEGDEPTAYIQSEVIQKNKYCPLTCIYGI